MIYRYALIVTLGFFLIGCNAAKIHFLDGIRHSGSEYALTNAINVNAALGKHVGYRYMGSDMQYHYFVYYSTGWRYGPYGFKVPLSDYLPKYYIDYRNNFLVKKYGYSAPKEYVEFYGLLGHDTSSIAFLYRVVDTTTQLLDYNRISLD